MAGALHDLTVVDLSRGVAGPMTGMLLADQGARVIKVEPPGGDPTRSLSGSRVWHRGKESVTLDLKSEVGQTALRRLVGRADILLTSSTPEVRQRLGCAYADMHSENDRLIYCAISGYGNISKHAGRSAIDGLLAARTGLQWEKRGWAGGSIERINGIEPYMSEIDIDSGDIEGPARSGPLFSALPWPSLSAFYLATVGISAALHVREVVGSGQLVETSLLQGALVNGLFTWQRVQRPEVPGYRMWVTDPRVPHGFFQSSDDHWVHQWVPQPNFALSARADPLRTDTDDGRTGMGPEEIVILRELLEPMRTAYRRFTAEEWETMAADASLSVQRIHSPEEALSTQSLLDDGCVVEVVDPEFGPIRHVGVTYRLDRCPVVIDRGAPLPGRDTDAVLHEALADPTPEGGRTSPQVSSGPLVALDRGPLSGIVVLDLGLAVAGPFGTQILADLGASVVKVNRKSDRNWTDLHMGMSCNRGKKSIIIDLKAASGLAAFHKMVEKADVVHSNMHWESMVALGVDYDSLRPLNPRLIFCHTRGFEKGPRINLVGHDQSASAIAGVAWEEGGMYDGGEPIWPNISLGDTGNGMLSAAAVIQALYHRDRTGEGQLVETSIAYVHLLNASSAWVGADGKFVTRPTLDRDQLGLGPLYRLYATQEGWLCLAVQSEQEWQSLAFAVECPGLIEDIRFATAGARAEHAGELTSALERAFSKRCAADWLARLDAAGVPAEISAEDFGLTLFDDAEMIEEGLVVKHEHRHYGHVEMLGRLMDFSLTPGVIDRGPAVPGRESRELLAEFGFAPSEIDELIRCDAVSEALGD